MSCSSESYPSTQQPTASENINPAMDLQLITPAMSQPTFPWSSPDPFGMRTAPSAPQAPVAASSARRRPGSRPSSQSPTNDDTSSSFRFVTATRPEEFRDPELMRTVRSHVMFGVVEGRQRVTSRPKKTTPSASVTSVGASTRGESSAGTAAAAAANLSKRHLPLRRNDSVAAAANPDNPQFMPREEALDIFQRYRVPRSTASLPGSTPHSDQGTDADSPESHRPSQSKRSKRSAMDTPTSASGYDQPQPADQQLVQPPQGGIHRLNPLYDSAYQVIGPFKAFSPPAPTNPFSSHDPFLALPQPMSADINMPLLKYYCHLYFGTRGMARAWLPQMIQSRESFLSTLAIATSHQDAMDGKLAPTHLTLMVQTEVFHLLNEAFDERWSRIKDTTIMSVVQLLCSELVNSAGPERRLFHEQGLRQLIVERGGLDRLGVQGELAAVATAMVYSSATFREGAPDALFAEYAAGVRTPVYGDRQVVPESPLFCPRARFHTLERSRRCDARTLQLIAKLKELADVASSPLERSSTWDMDQYKRGILAYVRGLPPAETLPEGVTEVEKKARWRYEACRLAGLLYAESLVERKPLSTLPAESSSSSAAAAAVSLDKLVEAIKRSDCPHSECWGDMTGVLYWITLVGGAAARDARQRRWLTALNVRCAIVLAFEHRNAVVVSLRKMERGMVKRE